MQHTVYLFDGFQLDVTRRQLLSAGGLVQRLNSRAMEALLLLVANAGQVVERRRLMQTVWPNTIVEDNNLNQCILAIRKALGETAGSNQFVMTVQGRGFCFVCPVRTRIQESLEHVVVPASGTLDAKPDRGAAPDRGAKPDRGATLRAWPSLHRAFWLGVALGAAVVAIALLPFALH